MSEPVPAPTTQDKIDKPHVFFAAPSEVTIDPALSKDEKIEVLGVLEQDARQLAQASDEGMTGGERCGLRDVLDAQAALEMSPVAYAYDLVLGDLRARMKADTAGHGWAVLEHALSALEAANKPSMPMAVDDAAAEIEDEIAREKLDP